MYAGAAKMSSNCSSTVTEVEAGDLVILSVLRAATAFLCAVIVALLLASVCIRLDRSQLIYRLLIYISASSLLTLLANTLQAVSAVCHAPWHPPTCVFVGFANQFTAWLLLLVSTWLMGVLSLRYWCPNNRSVLTTRRDVSIWIGVVLISALVAVIPLGTKGYGVNQAWCWLQETRVLEQWVLWHGWVLVVLGATLATAVTALCLAEKRLGQYYESSRGINSTNQQRNRAAAKKIKMLISYIFVYWVLVTIVIVLYQIPQVKRPKVFLFAMAILEPISIVVVPMVFIVHLQETRLASLQRAQEANFQHCEGEWSVSINTSSGGKGGKDKFLKKNQGMQYDNRQEELRESLLITLEQTDEFA